MVQLVMHLFFSTEVALNLNNHIISATIRQQRSLRQGNSFGPLLFDIAFDSAFPPSSSTINFDYHCQKNSNTAKDCFTF
ncbi:hypothetical protein BDF20DRAFT_848003 [Mycotypha africana]|uniref:uncharacterized protein n=1 Tax=Mycotypha africana TaxID=64632 RepID=UPI002301848C|nr:uncharacterized protein BDF20DRAFT_848003 [Mycotypha africana]KAI8992061.1 hypothetical protein BDF20DRAFT_848003 [Mycotypha africana]